MSTYFPTDSKTDFIIDEISLLEKEYFELYKTQYNGDYLDLLKKLVFRKLAEMKYEIIMNKPPTE
jgi:hypothetical protein